MEFFKRLFFQQSQPTTTENKSIHLNSSDDGAIGKVDNSEHASGRNYSDSASLLLINNNSTEQSAGDGNNNNRKSIRKNRKWLTTCNECGHFRFARLNSKRVINPNYPYEHSARGGCTVPSEYHILPGQKLKRMCICTYCSNAMRNFKNDVPNNKKLHQYIYI
jgi:hypothetical protein